MTDGEREVPHRTPETRRPDEHSHTVNTKLKEQYRRVMNPQSIFKAVTKNTDDNMSKIRSISIH